MSRKTSRKSYVEDDDKLLDAMMGGDDDEEDEDEDDDMEEGTEDDEGAPGTMSSPPVDEDGEEIYIVEKILDKKVTDGKVTYYLKWQGYGPQYDTWEPVENLDCDELIEDFEKEWTERQKRGFDRGLRAERIVSVFYEKPVAGPAPSTSTSTTTGGETEGDNKTFDTDSSSIFTPKPTFALVKWKDVSDADLVPLQECAEKIPQLLIKFYEDRRLGLSTAAEAVVEDKLDDEYVKQEGLKNSQEFSSDEEDDKDKVDGKDQKVDEDKKEASATVTTNE